MPNCMSRYSLRPANSSIHKFLIVNFVRQPFPLVSPLPQGLVQLPTNCCAYALSSSEIRLLGSCLLPRPLRVYFLPLFPQTLCPQFTSSIHHNLCAELFFALRSFFFFFWYLIFVATAFWHSFWGRLANSFGHIQFQTFPLHLFACPRVGTKVDISALSKAGGGGGSTPSYSSAPCCLLPRAVAGGIFWHLHCLFNSRLHVCRVRGVEFVKLYILLHLMVHKQ